MNSSMLYALDFDGVICDSAVETAITGWKAASCLWNNMPKAVSQTMIDQFRLVRPMIETGYEAILVMRLLYLGNSPEAIINAYDDKTQALLQQDQVSTSDLKKLFGDTRDAWIENDLADWVDMNPLFPGVAAKLQLLGQQTLWTIITTKQERFVKQILKANAIDLADEYIFGLDRNMSKLEVLTELVTSHPNQAIYFVEDRLPTLLNVMKNEHLVDVKLIFARWGYNTAEDKVLSVQHGLIGQELDAFLAC
jgi:phosphoglycolate phosphatase-like HAD superfamily hydrolase